MLLQLRYWRRSVAEYAEIIGDDQMSNAGVKRVNVRYLAAGCVHEE